MPPPPGWPSRAVRRKFSVRSLRKPTQSAVGRNSEKQSRISGGTTVGGGGRGRARAGHRVGVVGQDLRDVREHAGRVGRRPRSGPATAYSSVSVGADVRRRAELAEQRAVGLDVVDQARVPRGAAAVVLLPHVGERVAVGVGGAAGQRERRARRDREAGRGASTTGAWLPVSSMMKPWFSIGPPWAVSPTKPARAGRRRSAERAAGPCSASVPPNVTWKPVSSSVPAPPKPATVAVAPAARMPGRALGRLGHRAGRADRVADRERVDVGALSVPLNVSV